MAPADFLMLCDGNIFNNETLREAHGGICRTSHESSKFLCDPGAAADFFFFFLEKAPSSLPLWISVSLLRTTQWLLLLEF